MATNEHKHAELLTEVNQHIINPVAQIVWKHGAKQLFTVQPWQRSLLYGGKLLAEVLRLRGHDGRQEV